MSDQATQFQPQYWAPFRSPRTDQEAQILYNHIRTVAYYLDALPSIVDLPILNSFLAQHPYLAFGARNASRIPGLGLDAIIGLGLPIIGDFIGLIFGSYQIFLSWMFGLPNDVLGWMLINVIVDTLIGLIPLVGELLDFLFTSNLRNLTLLENHLQQSGLFTLDIPPSGSFRPSNKSSFWTNLLGLNTRAKSNASRKKRR